MRFLLLCLPLFLVPAAHAEEEEENKIEIPSFNITNHTYNLGETSFEYSAIAGKLPIIRDGVKIADIFFIAYGIDSEEDRPITFVFPGGPGGAGTMEAILSFGPRRLVTASEGRTILPPYKFIDNPETLLPFTDLVFVDPPDCGYSESSKDADLNSLYSIEGDLRCLGEFVHTYTDIFETWNSPKYLAGGSYGTLRCCGLTQELLDYGIFLNGIILHGCAFEESTLSRERDLALPDCLLLPTFAATAWYHNRLWPEKSLYEVIDYARRFAFEEYAPVMHQPSRLSPLEKSHFHKRLAEITGLSPDIVKRYDGRINESIYKSEFFFPERKVLGGTDSRYSGDISTIDPDRAIDPSYFDSLGAGVAFRAYLQNELEISCPFTPYISFSRRAFSLWSDRTYDSSFGPHFLQRLRHTMVVNPLMKVFVGLGVYDCRTPFAAAEYAFDHLELAPSRRNNLQFEYYEAGHGFIFDHPSLIKFKKDLIKFYTEQQGLDNVP